MRKLTASGLLALTVAFGGMAQANSTAAKPKLPVVAGVKALSTKQKAAVTGMGIRKLPTSDPQPPGQFPPGNSKVKQFDNK